MDLQKPVLSKDSFKCWLIGTIVGDDYSDENMKKAQEIGKDTVRFLDQYNLFHPEILEKETTAR